MRIRLEEVDFIDAITVSGNRTTQVRTDVNAHRAAESIEYESETGLIWIKPLRATDTRAFAVPVARVERMYPAATKPVAAAEVKK